MKIISTLISTIIAFLGYSQIQHVYESNKTLSYNEIIQSYEYLEETYLTAKLLEYGPSDAGLPIHLFVMGDTDKENKPTLLIMNGIHPGESCGIDASIKFAEDLLKMDSPILNQVNICIIPVYNVGGCLNRNSMSRANQNGPEEHGFRGNARNLDLNRDFIKCDSRNTETFYKIFHDWEPEVFIDTHTSNGADYQYVMTLITSQINKMNPELQQFTKNDFVPFIYDYMEESYPIVPYVQTRNRTPESGINDFLDTPRYSSGFTNLFNSIGFISEAHMLKPYRERVLSTYYLLNAISTFMSSNGPILTQLKKKADRSTSRLKTLFYNYELDTISYEQIRFKGYKHYYKESEVTRLNQLYYDSSSPKTFKTKYFNTFVAKDTLEVPKSILIPHAWRRVIEHLRMNGVEMTQLDEEREITTQFLYISDFESTRFPYENHYLHYEVKVEKRDQTVVYRKGDYLIELDQKSNRYILEILDPRMPDSFFAWNYFDGILQQKEFFSDYVFEPEAKRILKENPGLEKEFRLLQENDSAFAKNGWTQLFYIYQRSDYYEQSHNRYPIAFIY